MKTKKVDYLSYIICHALCVVLSKAGYSYPVSYTHLDVYKRQV